MAVIKAGKWTYTDEEFDRMYDEAKRRRELEAMSEVRALAARYDKASNRIVLDACQENNSQSWKRDLAAGRAVNKTVRLQLTILNLEC